MWDVLIEGGILPEGATGDDLRQFLVQASADFRDKAPVSAAQAATIILDGVRAGSWRILIGEDARMIDAAVRAKPEAAYDYADLFAGLTGSDSGSDSDQARNPPRNTCSAASMPGCGTRAPGFLPPPPRPARPATLGEDQNQEG